MSTESIAKRRSYIDNASTFLFSYVNTVYRAVKHVVVVKPAKKNPELGLFPKRASNARAVFTCVTI